MAACKTLVRLSHHSTPFSSFSLSVSSPRCLFASLKLGIWQNRARSMRCYSCITTAGAAALDIADGTEPVCQNIILEVPEDSGQDSVAELLSKSSDRRHDDNVARFMKMERKPEIELLGTGERWFPYLDEFKASNGVHLSSAQVLEALDPHIMAARKKRFREAVKNRSYSVSLVVEGLADFGNVSAAFRSADALGFQSVHVVSCDNSKRYKDNRHVSMGAEKWLDIEVWDSTAECFRVLKSRGFRIATTHVGIDAVSVYDMDWSCPTAIVVGNELSGISDEALELSDLHCSIPMKGMVDSFNVSVAAGILMHQAVCDRTSRMGCHGDLTFEESQILLAEFFLRHSKGSTRIADEYARRMQDQQPMSKL